MAQGLAYWCCRKAHIPMSAETHAVLPVVCNTVCNNVSGTSSLPLHRRYVPQAVSHCKARRSCANVWDGEQDLAAPSKAR
eukprot:1925289-Amphidinium_carterae.2